MVVFILAILAGVVLFFPFLVQLTIKILAAFDSQDNEGKEGSDHSTARHVTV